MRLNRLLLAALLGATTIAPATAAPAQSMDEVVTDMTLEDALFRERDLKLKGHGWHLHVDGTRADHWQILDDWELEPGAVLTLTRRRR